MYTRIVTFEMPAVTQEQYCEAAGAVADSFNEWPGLIAKLWIGDASTHRYGGIYLFTESAAADASRSSPQFTSLAGNPAIEQLRIEEFDILPELTERTGSAVLAGVATRC